MKSYRQKTASVTWHHVAWPFKGESQISRNSVRVLVVVWVMVVVMIMVRVRVEC